MTMRPATMSLQDERRLENMKSTIGTPKREKEMDKKHAQLERSEGVRLKKSTVAFVLSCLFA